MLKINDPSTAPIIDADASKRVGQAM